MNNAVFKRRFTIVLLVYTLLILCVWFVYHNTIFSYTSQTAKENIDLATNRLLSTVGEEFSDIKVAASVIGGSVYLQDFLTEPDITAYYEKAGTVAEIINKSISARSPFDIIITIDNKGNFYRFSGSLSDKSIQKIYTDFGNGNAVFANLEFEGTQYFCYVSPVIGTTGNVAKRIGSIVIANALSKTRRMLDKNQISTIDTAVISDEKILISTNRSLEGLSLSQLESSYGLVSVSDISGTELSVAAAVTRNALNMPNYMFWAGIGVMTLLYVLMMIILHRYLSRVMINPMLSSKEKMQIGLLGTQMDAHFVMNTIITVETLIHKGESDKAASVSGGLADIIKHQYKGTCNIFEEMSVLQQYIDIMNIRHNNRYNVSFDISDNLSEYMMQGFILQPIVENAFTHGFSSDSGYFLLTIRGKIENNAVVFEITDNGDGMSAESLLDIQTKLLTAHNDEFPAKGLDGVALLNIQKRIRLTSGERFGVSISSQLNQGTVVTVRLPIIKDNEPYKI